MTLKVVKTNLLSANFISCRVLDPNTLILLFFVTLKSLCLFNTFYMKCQLATRSNVLLRTFSQDNHSIVCISDTVGLNMPLYNMFKISISVCINWLFLWLKDLWYWQMPTYMCNHWIKFCCNFIPVAFFVTVVCHWL